MLVRLQWVITVITITSISLHPDTRIALATYTSALFLLIKYLVECGREGLFIRSMLWAYLMLNFLIIFDSRRITASFLLKGRLALLNASRSLFTHLWVCVWRLKSDLSREEFIVISLRVLTSVLTQYNASFGCRTLLMISVLMVVLWSWFT